MIDPLVLRSQIISILGTNLGTYTFSSGETDPAIAVLPDSELGWNFPPQGTKTDGVEIVVTIPYPGYIAYLSGAHVKTYRWEVLLKQWDTNGDLLVATEALVKGLDYLLTSPVPVARNDALGTIEQVRFEILEYEYQRA